MAKKKSNNGFWTTIIILAIIVIIALVLSGTFTGQATWEDEIVAVNVYLGDTLDMKPLDGAVNILDAMKLGRNFNSGFDANEISDIVDCIKANSEINPHTTIRDLAKDKELFSKFKIALNNCR